MFTKIELTSKIIEKVRAACKESGMFYGAIGVCYVPTPGFCKEWMESSDNSFGEMHFAEVTEGQDTLCFDDNSKIVGDSLGIVAMKIAGVRRLMKSYEEDDAIPTREQCTSGSLPDSMVITGITNWKGAIAVEVGVRTGIGCQFHGTKALTIFVGVSGGTQEQDEAAAWTALDVIKESVEQDFPETMLSRTFYD